MQAHVLQPFDLAVLTLSRLPHLQRRLVITAAHFTGKKSFFDAESDEITSSFRAFC